MKIAICGLGPTYKEAPWNDAEWKKWSLAKGHEYIHWSDKVFEMHDLSIFDDERIEYLSEIDNLITQKNYPLDEVTRKFPDYFSCTIDYMIALAIHEGCEEIALYGVSASDRGNYGKGYISQRAGIEFWIGVAVGNGIKITLPYGCPLLKFDESNHEERKWVNRYGYR